ncbi:hypothetical protein [Chiayiivirga flava]|uniref:IPT/TIG domain-containing protein n=1 Tax=Chiayiivirga flava TaxID=659595 RepID=A0A7W8D9H8_9GAMM|nr:hypothetical protein [Chiayiivirga flava]MBB5209056.1 hypothetical protein [Chiayiivirga flava]
MRVALMALLLGAVGTAFATPPTCGVGGSFNPSPGWAILPPENTTPDLSVAYPANGATVGNRVLQVRGRYEGPPNTGVSVNGLASLQSGDYFLSQDVLLSPGLNTITVVLTPPGAAPLSVSRTVTYDPNLAAPAHLSASMTGDYAPFSTRFDVSLSGSSQQIVRVRADYRTDGTYEFDTGLNSDQNWNLSTIHRHPGLFQASVEVTLDDGALATPQVIVSMSRWSLGEDLQRTRYTLCKVFETYREQLSLHQYSAALEAFTEEARAELEAFTLGLGNNGASVASQLGEIIDGTIGADTAELTLARPVTGTPGTFDSYPILFIREADGVWRISSL